MTPFLHSIDLHEVGALYIYVSGARAPNDKIWPNLERTDVMTSPVLATPPLYIEDDPPAWEQLLEASTEKAAMQYAAAVESLRDALAPLLDRAEAAQTAAAWQLLFEDAASTYHAAAAYFHQAEPVALSLPVYRTSDTRRYEQVLAYGRSQYVYGGDREATLPAPNGVAQVRLQRLPLNELIQGHIQLVGRFREAFQALLLPSRGLIETARRAIFARPETAQLAAAVDGLLFTLCGDSEITVEGSRLGVRALSRRDELSMKLQVLEAILDPSSQYATVD